MSYKYESILCKDQYQFNIKTNDRKIVEDLKNNISFDKTYDKSAKHEVINISFNDLSMVPDFAKVCLEKGEIILIHGGTPEQHVYGIKYQCDDVSMFYIPKNNEYVIKKGDTYALYGKDNGREKNLYRIVREIYYRKGLSLGRIAIHSAAVCNLNNRGVLITGDKAKGKTSMLFNLLATNDYKFVDNDRILLELKSDNLFAHSMSSTVNVGYGSMRIIPERFSNIDLTNKNNFDKLKYTKEEFIKQVNCDYSSSAFVDSVIFPYVDKENTDEIEEIIDEDKSLRIYNSLEKFDNGEHPDWLGIANVSEYEYDSHKTRIMRYISEFIPAHEITFGYERINPKILKLVKDDLR